MAFRRLVCLVLAARLAMAVCDCGFTVRDPKNETEAPWLFADMLESDFTKMHNISQDHDWMRQEYNVSARAGRGPYGEEYLVADVELEIGAQRLQSHDNNADGDGLVLRVGASLSNNKVECAEIDTTQADLLWGSYRAGMKLTDVPGTCAAFFWYFNNTQEIDMEFLSAAYDRGKHIFPVNLVVQSEQALLAGYNAKNTGLYQQFNLSFDPTTDFHEYRFDLLPGRVLFYADSKVIGEMHGHAVPTHPGRLILSHWSNGNPEWSAGPPTTSAYVTVTYVKAYFNATDAPGLGTRCGKGGTSCAVPDVTAANASTGGSFFNQEASGGDGGGVRSSSNSNKNSPSTRLGARGLTWGVMVATAFMLMAGY